MQSGLREIYTPILEMIMNPTVSDDAIYAQLKAIFTDFDAEMSAPLLPDEKQILQEVSERCAKFRPELMERMVQEFIEEHERDHLPSCTTCQAMKKKAEEQPGTKEE